MKSRAVLQSTEVGAIPADWKVVTLGDLNPFITSGSRGWAEFYSESGSAFLRITNMSRETVRLDLTELRRVRLPAGTAEGKRTELRNDDVLISITADVGIVCHVDASLPKPAYINQHIALVRLDPAQASGQFVSYLLAAYRAQKVLRGVTDQGAKTGMGLDSIRKIRVPLPSLGEQRAIAAALGDKDALIVSLDQLIAKKRNIKLAAAHQLLSGECRLRGHAVGWREVTLDKIAPLQRGFDLPNSQLCAGPYPVVYSNGILNYHAQPMARGPGVVTGRSGTLGRVTYVEADYWPHNTSLWVTDFKGNDPKFISCLLTHIRLERFGTGTGVPTLNRNDVHAFSVRLPQSVEEQRAIAGVISDMDAEIAALEARRNKTKALKQAMMQELLTGRTRLV